LPLVDYLWKDGRGKVSDCYFSISSIFNGGKSKINMNQHYITYDTLISFRALPITVADTPIIRVRPDGLILGAEMYREHGDTWLDGVWSEIPKLPEPIMYKSDSIQPHAPLAPITYFQAEIKPRTIVSIPYEQNPLGDGIALTFTILATAIFICKLYLRYAACNPTPINRAV